MPTLWLQVPPPPQSPPGLPQLPALTVPAALQLLTQSNIWPPNGREGRKKRLIALSVPGVEAGRTHPGILHYMGLLANSSRTSTQGCGVGPFGTARHGSVWREGGVDLMLGVNGLVLRCRMSKRMKESVGVWLKCTTSIWS